MLKQTRIQDSLLKKTEMLDSMFNEYKSSNFSKKTEIGHIKDNSTKILKLQKQILRKIK